ncbi:hypothetical protein Leryth_001028 [Lithospermum erythrorhizon]|nr:hypothetical protein Leryth_001028 [Lithospermum erythrorhizon]
MESFVGLAYCDGVLLDFFLQPNTISIHRSLSMAEHNLISPEE